MRYRFEIDSNNAISIWDEENPNPEGAPFLFQPSWPGGTPWADKAQAEGWVTLLIENLENPQSEFLPGDSPEQPRIPRPEIEPEEEQADA